MMIADQRTFQKSHFSWICELFSVEKVDFHALRVVLRLWDSFRVHFQTFLVDFSALNLLKSSPKS